MNRSMRAVHLCPLKEASALDISSSYFPRACKPEWKASCWAMLASMRPFSPVIFSSSGNIISSSPLWCASRPWNTEREYEMKGLYSEEGIKGA